MKYTLSTGDLGVVLIDHNSDKTCSIYTIDTLKIHEYVTREKDSAINARFLTFIKSFFVIILSKIIVHHTSNMSQDPTT